MMHLAWGTQHARTQFFAHCTAAWPDALAPLGIAEVFLRAVLLLLLRRKHVSSLTHQTLMFGPVCRCERAFGLGETDLRWE